MPEVSHKATKGSFLAYLFEAVSAYGTVGLSMGVTKYMHDLSKFLIIILMYIGRLGPLTPAIALKSKKETKIKYLEKEKGARQEGIFIIKKDFIFIYIT
jgi:trk system potassium uptake protein TrkH